MSNQILLTKELQIDKSTWKLIKLGDLVDDISVRVDKPANSEYDKFVGLDNFITGELKIKTWSATQSLTSSAKAFKAGDILFARRNAYLRRASLVDFDGCCSGDAFVIRENLDKVVPGFIAFLMNSNNLWDYANSNAAGTMSKRVKWRDLAEYEFLLPPKNEQVRLSNLLWTMDEVIEKEKLVLENFRIFLQSSLKQIFQSNSKRTSLINLCLDTPKYGANSPSCEYDNKVRYIRITDIGDFGQLNAEKVSSIEHEDKYLLSYGDFLFARTADPGRSYYYKVDDGICSYAGYLIKFKLDLNKIIPEYLYYYTQTLEFKSWITKTTRKGTISNINAAEFSKLKIPFVEISKQKDSIEKIKSIYKLLMKVDSKLKSSQSLQKSMINNIF